jgi:small subunit ribosomal protein S18
MTLVNEPINREQQKKKYCRFKKNGIKYIDYKDATFLTKFVNEQGKILPRRLQAPVSNTRKRLPKL